MALLGTGLVQEGGFSVWAGFLGLAKDWVGLAALGSLQLLHNFDGCWVPLFDSLWFSWVASLPGVLLVIPAANLDKFCVARTEDHSSILITPVSHVRFDPGCLILGNAHHLQGSMDVLLIDLGQFITVQATNLLSLLPANGWGDNHKIAMTPVGLLGMAVGETGVVIRSPGVGTGARG